MLDYLLTRVEGLESMLTHDWLIDNCRRVLSACLNPTFRLKILQTYTASLVPGHSK